MGTTLLALAGLAAKNHPKPRMIIVDASIEDVFPGLQGLKGAMGGMGLKPEKDGFAQIQTLIIGQVQVGPVGMDAKAKAFFRGICRMILFSGRTSTDQQSQSVGVGSGKE